MRFLLLTGVTLVLTACVCPVAHAQTGTSISPQVSAPVGDETATLDAGEEPKPRVLLRG